MENNIILSIVVPTYNMEKLLPRCLDSISSSDFQGLLEVIVVNDGSKDNSLTVALEYQTKFPTIVNVIDKENAGHGSTINAGLQVAQGKYFKVLDSDDWFDTSELQILINELRNSNEDMILTKFVTEYLHEGRSEVSFNLLQYGIEPNKSIPFDRFDWKKIGYFIPMHCISYKTSLLKNLKIEI